MSSSPELGAQTFAPLETPELRTGTWTRLGDGTVLGDAVTEQVLTALAETARTAARSQGYAVGWAEGQRAARAAAAEEALVTAERHRLAEEHRDAEHRSALATLAAAACRLGEAVTEVCADVEDRTATLAADLTTTIVGSCTADVDAVRRALALAPEGPMTRLLVHPLDAAAIDAETAATLASRGCVLVGEPLLERGDALIEYDDAVLDLRISTALDRVRQVLR